MRITAQQRRDREVALAVIDSVFAEKPSGVRRSFEEFLRAAINYLSQHHPDRWGVTLFEWGVRLNVGWVECIVLDSGGLRVLIEEESAPRGTTFDGSRYEKAPGCAMTKIELSELPRALTPVLESHYAALSTAAKYHPSRSIRNAHSAGVTKVFTLPDPDYYRGQERAAALDEEAQDGVAYVEGSIKQVWVNRYERDNVARDACIGHHGAMCSACGFDFAAAYGEVAAGFIHVHHLIPLSTIGRDYVVNPVEDLRPVCPNCHAIIHRRTPPYSIEDVQRFLNAHRFGGV